MPACTLHNWELRPVCHRIHPIWLHTSYKQNIGLQSQQLSLITDSEQFYIYRKTEEYKQNIRQPKPNLSSPARLHINFTQLLNIWFLKKTKKQNNKNSKNRKAPMRTFLCLTLSRKNAMDKKNIFKGRELFFMKRHEHKSLYISALF